MLGVLVVWNTVANLVVPDALLIPVNLAGAAAVVVVARSAAVSWSELGLAGANLRRASVAGAQVAAGIAVLVLAVAFVPWGRDLLADARFLGVGPGELAYETLLRIPLATALAEEVAFRGVLLGMLMLWLSPLRAVVVSSAVFGLWHILPGLAAVDTTGAVEVEGSAVTAGAVAAQVLVTAAAGAGFGWLRLRSRHVAAPTLAHWALNGVAFGVGWLVVQGGWG